MTAGELEALLKMIPEEAELVRIITLPHNEGPCPVTKRKRYHFTLYFKVDESVDSKLSGRFMSRVIEDK